MEDQNGPPFRVCANCKSANPQEKKYCGDCGAFLDTVLGPVKDYLDTNLRTEVLSVLKDQFKDQRFLQSEIAEGIATKISGWTKLLAFFVGIPLGILILTLGVIGINNYLDFMNFVAKAKKDTEQRVEDARKDGEAITTEYQSLKDQLAQATTLANDVRVLSEKVDLISEKIGFEPSAALTPALKTKLEGSLRDFQKHFQELGYKGTETGVKIHINLKAAEFGPAYYLDGSIQVESGLAADTDVLFREYSHHVLFNSNKINTVSGNKDAVALESGLASYFSCSYNDDAIFGEQSIRYWEKRDGKEAAKDLLARGYVQNLKNTRTFEELQTTTDFSYIGAEVWGGVFWDIRESFTKDKADKLIFQAWQSLKVNGSETDLRLNFYNQLLETEKSLEGETNLNQISDIFRKRGLPI